MAITAKQARLSADDIRLLKPTVHRLFVDVDEEPFSELLDRRQPVGSTRNRRPPNSQLDVFNVAIGAGGRSFKSCKSVETRDLSQPMNSDKVFYRRGVDADTWVGPCRPWERFGIELRCRVIMTSPSGVTRLAEIEVGAMLRR